MSKSSTSWGRIALLCSAGVALPIFAMFLAVDVLNADFHPRYVETRVAKGVGISLAGQSAVPTARLVLHKILTEENAIEVSLILAIDGGDMAEEVRAGRVQFTATVRDGQMVQPYSIRHSVTLNASSASDEAGVLPVAVKSERFLLPTQQSVVGYPFDDILVRPIISVRQNQWPTTGFRAEIQRAVTGRVMKLSEENIVTIQLTRSPTEKMLVLGSSVIFLILSAMLAFGLFASKRHLTTVEELVAFGGYLIGAAGFRDLLGVSRTTGTSALEIAIIGLPLVFLASGMTVSFVRGQLKTPPDLPERPAKGAVA